MPSRLTPRGPRTTRILSCCNLATYLSRHRPFTVRSELSAYTMRVFLDFGVTKNWILRKPLSHDIEDIVASSNAHRLRWAGIGLTLSLAACGATVDAYGDDSGQSLDRTAPIASTGSAPSLQALPLIHESSLKYVGAFRFPNLYTGNVCHGFTYGGRGLTFNPTGNGGAGSLFSAGHVGCSYVGEFTIPDPGIADTVERLPMAQLLQPKGGDRIVDALEGGLAASGIGGGTEVTVNGLLVYRGDLYLSAGNSYASTQPVTHWRRPLDIAVSGRVAGPATVAGRGRYSNPRFTAGYMCHVPPELQPALGAPALTGWVADSIVTGTSNGPAAFAFDPASIDGRRAVPAVPLVFYPSDAPLQESIAGESQNTWNWTSIPRGCALPDGSRSLIFIGRHGTGKFEYGVGGVNGYTNDASRRPIYDPADDSAGEHAWPYRYQVWAYDALHLAKVKQGITRPESIRPYAVWTLNLPFEVREDGHDLEGVAYDPGKSMLYLVQSNAAKFGEAIIHAFRVTKAN